MSVGKLSPPRGEWRQPALSWVPFSACSIANAFTHSLSIEQDTLNSLLHGGLNPRGNIKKKRPPVQTLTKPLPVSHLLLSKTEEVSSQCGKVFHKIVDSRRLDKPAEAHNEAIHQGTQLEGLSGFLKHKQVRVHTSGVYIDVLGAEF